MTTRSVIALTSDKGGVGKSTLAVNLAGALSLNAPTILIDEDPIRSCLTWAERNGSLPMQVKVPPVSKEDLQLTRYIIIDTEGRPKFDDVVELVKSSTLVVIPCGTSGLELDATISLIRRLKEHGVTMDKVRVAITKAPPVGTVGQQARDALREAGVPVMQAVVRHYAAHLRAAELGVLVKDVPDQRASQAWSDILELALEVAGR